MYIHYDTIHTSTWHTHYNHLIDWHDIVVVVVGRATVDLAVVASLCDCTLAISNTDVTVRGSTVH